MSSYPSISSTQVMSGSDREPGERGLCMVDMHDLVSGTSVVTGYGEPRWKGEGE